MTGINKFFLGLISLALVFAVYFSGNYSKPAPALASSLDNLSGWAWSDNIGWISFNCTTGGIFSANICSSSNYGVNIDANGNLVGYAWNSSVGWVQFGNLSGFPELVGRGSGNAKYSLSTGNLSGWARAISAVNAGSNSGHWDGWISLSGSNYGVNFSNTGNGSGYALGSTDSDISSNASVIGWIDFSGVRYNPGQPGLTLTANPNNFSCSTSLPTTVTLSWQTQNVTSCTTPVTTPLISPVWSSVALPNGSKTGVQVSSFPQSYTMTCTGTSGPVSSTAVVSCIPPVVPPIEAECLPPNTLVRGVCVPPTNPNPTTCTPPQVLRNGACVAPNPKFEEF